MPYADTNAMNLHLVEISTTIDPGAHAVILVDQAGWHTTPRLEIPDNITLMELPPRAPELNPPFRRLLHNRLSGNGRKRLAVHAPLSAPLRDACRAMDNWLSNRVFDCYDDIVAFCCEAWNRLIERPWAIRTIGMRDWAHRS